MVGAGADDGLVGLLIILLAIALGLRSRDRPACRRSCGARCRPAAVARRESGGDDARADPTGRAQTYRRTLLAIALCLASSPASRSGTACPSPVEGAVFIFVFTTIFSWPRGARAGRRVARALRALAIAVRRPAFDLLVVRVGLPGAASLTTALPPAALTMEGLTTWQRAGVARRSVADRVRARRDAGRHHDRPAAGPVGDARRGAVHHADGKMAPNDAILVLICVYVGAIYGGSRTAILLNIPGTAANAAACLDGNMLARQGKAGRAMGIATTGFGRRFAVRRDRAGDVHAAAGRGRAVSSAPSNSSGSAWSA